jgi:L-2-hydroxyglutarate oxidase LhgO
MDRVDVIVIGAGVIGLAIGRAMILGGRSVIIVERHAHPGTETSSRNSGVIHSGIYYPTGSAKARLCVRGSALLYEYCEARRLLHRRCGKLIVAQQSEVPKLQKLQDTALRNGVGDLAWLDPNGIAEKEPAVRASAGLWCPSTGIVGVHEYMTSLHGDLEDAGGVLALRTEFIAARATSQGFEVDLRSDGEVLSLGCATLVNSAGLAATSQLSAIDGYPAARIPGRFFAKGNYFEFSGRSPFRHLVYPMPGEAGLGVHATLDMGGQLRFGPDVEWIDPPPVDFDYSVAEERGRGFYGAIREYWPGLPDASLRPSYSGIRPKLVGAGSPAADFQIEGPAEHGVAGLINLLGMESPGLTSSLAIGEEVVRIADAMQ